MKLITFKYDNREQAGILSGGTVLPLHHTMNAVVRDAALLNAPGEAIPLDKVEVLAPLPCPDQDIVCLGMNYTEHAEEAFGYSSTAFASDKAVPVFFSKRATWCQGSGEPIPAHADLTQRLDYETELAVILGKDALNVPEDEVEQYIFGYTVLNDVSARDLQTGHKQWYFGKSLDGFCPMGPCIVTRDEVAWPPALRIFTKVNGETRQDSNTRMLIHGIAEIVSTLSKGMLLRAGTVIATGTPRGVAMGMEPPKFLVPGDLVECTIEGIGTLSNRVE